MSLDLDTFKVLSTIVETGSFAKAAEKLGRAQSAISYKIKKLEMDVGQAVFDRQQYRAELTDTGRLLLREGNKLLQQAQHIESLVAQQQQGWEQRLDIVMDGVVPIRPLLKVLRDLEDKNIPTRIQLNVEHLTGVQQRFNQSSADLMIAKEFEFQENLKVIPLGTLTNTLVVSRHHPLASQHQVTRAQLQSHVELTIRDSSRDAQKSTIAGQPLFGGDKVFFLSDFQQKKQALLMGLGFGWIPSPLIFDELVANELVAIDFIEGNIHQFQPKLIYRRDRPLGKTLSWLLENVERIYIKS